MTSKQVILLTVPGLSFFYFRLRNKQFAATKCSIRLRMTWWPVYQLCRNLCAHWGIFLPPVWPVCVFFFCPLKQYKFAQKHTNCLPNILLAFVKAVEFRQIWSHCLPPPPPPKKRGMDPYWPNFQLTEWPSVNLDRKLLVLIDRRRDLLKKFGQS